MSAKSIILFYLLTVLHFCLFVTADNFIESKWKTPTNDFSSSNYTLNQPGCQIPKLDLFSQDVMKFYGREADFFCDLRVTNTSNITQPALFVEDEMFLYFNASALRFYESKEVNCTYRSFERKEDAQDTVRYSTVVRPLHTDRPNKIPDEFVEVICNNSETEELIYKDYFAFLPLKPATETRSEKMATKDRSINSLIIGLDTISRLQFHRHFPLSVNFLKNRMHAIEMYAYNKVAENTYPNLVSLLSGLSDQQLSTTCLQNNKNLVDTCPLIWNKFHEKGFRTIFVEDAPDLAIFNYGANGFQYQPTDYYLRPMYLQYEKNAGHDNIGCGYRCLGSRSSLSFLLNHALKTARVFQNKKYFAFHWSCSATHDTFNIPKQVDETVLDFLNTLQRDNLLNNTVLIVMADHGPRMPGRTAFVHTLQGKCEKRLPLLMFVFPDWFQKKYSTAVENLQRNSNMLTSHFDLHYTLHDLMNLTRLETANLERRYLSEGKSNGRSLFLPISPYRNCRQADIPEEFCACNCTGQSHAKTQTDYATNLIQETSLALQKFLQAVADAVN